MRRLALILLVCAPLALYAQSVDPKVYSGLKWREIGPFRGGRSVACSGVVGKPNEFYMGTCGGGLWKTTDAGETWKCVTDGYLGVGVVGAVAVSTSKPDVVYIGTGEKDIRGNISHGDGVYKSTDGGKTWVHVGLKDTQTVSRIVVHPTNPDIVWVAALGHVYGQNRERGVFKSTDGGATWRKVLYESDKAGAGEVCIDVKNPNVLYAATWEAWRNPYHMNSGGPGSKIWKSTDGGESWSDITRSPGLPTGVIGKVGLSVSPVDPNKVWALVEALDGGLFRSDDAGANWKLVNDDNEYRQRAWYFSRVVADPQERDTVYVLNLGVNRSKDGGVKFTGLSSRHGDEHDLWIDPADNKRMVNSDDGGATVTINGGQRWTEEDFPTAQFYHVTTDSSVPYKILGAQQDNSTVRIASRTNGRGIGPTDWTSTAGGESGYVTARPDNADVVFGGSYGGEIGMMNHRTGEFRDVSPWPDNPMGHGAEDSKYRFQWTFPIVFSPHDANVLYTCSQHVHKSTDGGGSWTEISPDLTRNDPSTLRTSGGPITQDNTSVEYYATVFTLAESPKARGTIWAGSDDGLVHVTRDAGKTWTNVTPKDMPKWGLCSMIDASPHTPGRAFLAVDNHESDDYRPYAYRTDDFGKTWTSISTGIPESTFVRVVREDPIQPDLLYCGTETGVYVSFDGGAQWQPLQNNLPVTPVHDLTVKEDDLIVATHGRSFWVLDRVNPLRFLASVRLGEQALLLPVRPTAKVGGGGFGGGGGGGGTNVEMGQNPQTGILIDYWLPTTAEKVEIKVVDSSGVVVGTASAPTTSAGLQRVAIRSLSYPGYKSFPGIVLWAGRGGAIPAPPGEYTVQLEVAGKTLSQKLRYQKKVGSAASDIDLVEQTTLARKIAARITEANDAVARIRDIYKGVDEAVKEKPGLSTDGDRLKSLLRPIEETIYQTKSKASEDPLNFPIRLNDKLSGVLGTVLSSDFRPTKQSIEVFGALSKQLQPQLDGLKAVIETELVGFNAKLKSEGLKVIVPVGLSK